MKEREKVAFIRGLVEGLEIDVNTKEGKVIAAIIDLLDDLALSVYELEQNNDEVWDVIDELDEDLGAVEDDFYEDFDECSCEDDLGDEFYEIVCPTCEEKICIGEDLLLDGEMECPKCGENLEFDFDSIKEKCECEPECDCEPECNCK